MTNDVLSGEGVWDQGPQRILLWPRQTDAQPAR
jgi:hypothetical protein